ncbi:DEAD/DEAH box helicase family protein [Chryseobacterium sp. APV1]|uniref:DEAD/DEAH box helicase family protein n=1 Tax=Chryseobacterium urinae TaxID=3058400 RepID=A0ABT8TZN6_9FLAO|nr:DEAD/DEAH box helicase [Chryseobacterium sp. APV1]MDO3424275.1 DEAD/DEAH box helicase family protein [Chryseobacterium sp. APV1]
MEKDNHTNYIKPINLVKVEYAQTGQSKKTNEMGMREMQANAYEARTAKYLLLKAPPASGKSRALMFIALDKLIHQGIKKAIVAVPERSIGNSFSPTELKKYGFYANWEPNQKYNLCTPGSDAGKVKAFHQFLQSDEKVLICTHATLRFAFEELDEKELNDCLITIDEFHHVSADGDNKLGNVMRNIMANSTAHIVAMTGSYFRGDSVPVLLPEDEEKFVKVTYNYYDQLNGYEYLKSLGIGYHFYQGRYYKVQPERNMSALEEILDEDLKTIIHIPSVNSAESSKQKNDEVTHVIDCIGELDYQDSETGVLFVKSKRSGRILKIADLVNDNPKDRDKIVAYLRGVSSPDDIDMIIALGMAKEGFDWPFCQHALTIGYRGSLTEIIQIIGRATRDSSNKKHAQFTNLIAQPDAVDDDVKLAVNNMLKAITASLLMEQVLAPNFKFKPMDNDEDDLEDEEEENGKPTIKIRGFKTPTSQRAKDIIETDLNDLKARILQDDTMLKALPGNLEPEVINTVLIPKIIREVYPDLSEDDVEAVRQYVVVDSVIKNSTVEEQGSKKFIKMAGSFVNIDDINIELIDRVNPFQKAFEILSKSVTTSVLRAIQDTINITKIEMTEQEAIILWPKINAWVKETGEKPNIQSTNPIEQRLAQALLFIQDAKRKRMQNG